MHRALSAGMAAAVALGGCGGDFAPEPQREGGDIGALGRAPESRSTSLGARTVDVRIDAKGYSPKTAEVPTGAVVRWTNRDDRFHTVTTVARAKQQFDSGPLGPGESFRVTTTVRGWYAYRSTAPGDGRRFRGVVKAR